jgi:hypothetical protein
VLMVMAMGISPCGVWKNSVRPDHLEPRKQNSGGRELLFGAAIAGLEGFFSVSSFDQPGGPASGPLKPEKTAG